MGCFGSKDKLSKEDMDFLKSHTRYDESTIKEWYKGFKVKYTRHVSIVSKEITTENPKFFSIGYIPPINTKKSHQKRLFACTEKIFMVFSVTSTSVTL